jgi:hypothetical protein
MATSLRNLSKLSGTTVPLFGPSFHQPPPYLSPQSQSLHPPFSPVPYIVEHGLTPSHTVERRRTRSNAVEQVVCVNTVEHRRTPSNTVVCVTRHLFLKSENRFCHFSEKRPKKLYLLLVKYLNI